MAEGDTLVNALVGAVVTVLTTFTGVAPLLGGLVAGYLNRRDGVTVGALSGVIAAIPVLGMGFVLGGLFAFMPVMGGMMRAGPGPGIVGGFGVVVVIVGLLFYLLYSVGLGALGGYLGVYIYEEDVI